MRPSEVVRIYQKRILSLPLSSVRLCPTKAGLEITDGTDGHWPSVPLLMAVGAYQKSPIEQQSPMAILGVESSQSESESESLTSESESESESASESESESESQCPSPSPSPRVLMQI